MPYSATIGRTISRNLANLTRLVGTEKFYPQIADIIGKTLGIDRTVVSRYSKYDRPEIIVNNAVSNEILELYYGGLYRMDALYSLCRTGPKASVVTVQGLSDTHLNDEWITGLLRMAHVSDEIAMLLPAPGETTIVVSCVRRRLTFSIEEIDTLEALQPLLEALHGLHLEQIYSRMLAGIHHQRNDSSPRGSAVFNPKGICVYSDEFWHKAIEQLDEYGAVLSEILDRPEGDLIVEGCGIVHWEEFRPAVPVINSCKIAMFERTAQNPVRLSPEDMLVAFKEAHELTPREIDVVREVVAGYSNGQIATRLGITVGTVKNCRWRLYYKLDITTERELFCMFLGTILLCSQSMAVA